MRRPLVHMLATLILVSLLALVGCTAGTNGTGGSTPDSNSGSASTGTQTDIPASGEPLASGTPVMYEFYSDT